ncbi:uncharacterized protein LOC120267636 [Dioscorea cayenensis subsp. rotundata]|uniref:Uncharacterized protein LOC120267636 n=1 Tax=Dioscorea cayennensis subsp. rotundata TaxID=55577 RepID=A0AB40BUW7_DIOCR|nr:uncharacterized protein LOC120267636 [Dioscorea cayenensis subsp. rotundata]
MTWSTFLVSVRWWSLALARWGMEDGLVEAMVERGSHAILELGLRDGRLENGPLEPVVERGSHIFDPSLGDTVEIPPTVELGSRPHGLSELGAVKLGSHPNGSPVNDPVEKATRAMMVEMSSHVGAKMAGVELSSLAGGFRFDRQVTSWKDFETRVAMVELRSLIGKRTAGVELGFLARAFRFGHHAINPAERERCARMDALCSHVGERTTEVELSFLISVCKVGRLENGRTDRVTRVASVELHSHAALWWQNREVLLVPIVKRGSKRLPNTRFFCGELSGSQFRFLWI